MVRVGVVTVPSDPWPETEKRVRRLESLGFAHLWVYDHLTWRRFHDQPWHATYPWLTGVAAATESLRIGTMVSSPNIHHPLVLAKDAMTIDHISGGRLTIGVGAGGTGYDATTFGQAELSRGERASRLGEYVDVLDGLLAGGLHDHDGDWYTVRNARMLPGCVQRPRVPLAVAAGAPRTLALAAERADAWITYGDPTSDDQRPAAVEASVREQIARIEARCEEIGRDPAEIDRIFMLGVSDERPLRSVPAFLEFAERYESLGFTDVVFHDPRPGDEVWNEPPEVVDELAAALYGAD